MLRAEYQVYGPRYTINRSITKKDIINICDRLDNHPIFKEKGNFIIGPSAQTGELEFKPKNGMSYSKYYKGIIFPRHSNKNWELCRTGDINKIVIDINAGGDDNFNSSTPILATLLRRKGEAPYWNIEELNVLTDYFKDFGIILHSTDPDTRRSCGLSTELELKTKRDLQVICNERNLNTSGNKNDLRMRLREDGFVDNFYLAV